MSRRDMLFYGLVAGCFAANAQTATVPATITFTFDNPALQPPHYSIAIQQDGTGRYAAQPSSAAPEGGAGDPDAARPQPLNRGLVIGDPLRTQLFAISRRNHLFATACEDSHSKIAFTGTKTLAYAGPDGAGSCTFNYARNPQIERVADELIGVANTLEAGRRLELLLAHDRLGLDAALEELAAEQADGRALQLGNIAPVLRAIAADEEVLHRTRTRAEQLLSARDPGR